MSSAPSSVSSDQRPKGAVVVAIAAWVAWGMFAETVASGGPTDAGLGAVTFIAALAGATLTCILRAWESRTLRRVAVAGAVAAYGWSAAAYAFAGDAATKAFPSIYDSGLVAFYALALVAVVQFIRTHVIGTPRAIWLDAAALAAAASAVGGTLLLPALGAHPTAGAIGNLLYVLSDLTLLAFVFAAWGLSGWRSVPTLWCFAGGALALALADGSYVVAGGTGSPPTISVILWPAAMLLIATATFWQPEPRRAVVSSWAKVGVPTVAAATSLAVLGASHGRLAEWFAIAALSIVVIRLVQNLRENSELFATVAKAAITDPLTGLGNRQLLLDRLEAGLERSRIDGDRLAVLFLDIDDFKLINDSLGHAVGDEVLGIVARRLTGVLRGERSDTVARLGGDEFVVLMNGLHQVADAGMVAQRILDALRSPIQVGEHQLAVDASLGVTIADGGEARSPVEILRDADTAMYAAKYGGKGNFRLFADEMHEAMVERVELTGEIRSALAGDEFRLLFQPQVDLETGAVVGVEALVRWDHPCRGLLTPDAFIPMAEATGIIADLDDWVLGAACVQARAWHDAGHELPVAINISPRRLAAGGLAERVERALADTGLPGSALEIEITESSAVENDEDTIWTLQRLRSRGVAVAIDDFGTGHSSLGRLQAFPVDRLKIDRSFVSPLGETRAARGSIAAAMVAIADSLGLHVIAEGVETVAQWEALRSLGCPVAQGFLFARPLPADEVQRLFGRSLVDEAQIPSEPVVA